MATELWFREPWNYARELASTGYAKVAWSWQSLVKRRINPIVSAEMYFAGLPWEALCIGTQGATHFLPGDELDSPTAVYPVWSASQPTSVLEHFLNNPAGENQELCSDETVEEKIRPVLGQQHRIVIIDIPLVSSSAGKVLLSYLSDIQAQFPEVILHISGKNSFRTLFGLGFVSCDFSPRWAAAGGHIILPTGLKGNPDWVGLNTPHYLEMFDYAPRDLDGPKAFCVYNIRSALWAAEHYTEEVNFVVRKGTREKNKETIKSLDLESLSRPEKRLTKSYLTRSKKAYEGDKFACNFCSLQLVCKLFRVGAVCAVPGSEPVPLSKFFGTRDSQQIIDGLSLIVQGQANRLEDALKTEDTSKGKLDPEISKELTRTFQNGVKLAQLIDPNLRTGAKVQVNVNGGSAQVVAQANSQDLIGGVVRQLEAQGVKREDITNEMIEHALAAVAAGRRPLAIDGL